MNAIIVLVLCVIALESVICNAPVQFIVGGRDAEPGDAPWMVSLSSDQSDGKHVCGGSILDSTHILTARHCVQYMDPKYNHLKARIGSLDLDQGGVQYDVVSIAVLDYYSDMAILCTSKEISLDSTLPVPTGKVALPTTSTDLAPGTMVRVAGWGVNTTDGTTFTEKLQVVDIPIVSPEDCASAYGMPYIPDFGTCAGADGMGPCVGDAGGPLTLGGVQYGMAYAGSFPCTSAPGIFIDVGFFIDPLNTNLQSKCFDVIPY